MEGQAGSSLVVLGCLGCLSTISTSGLKGWTPSIPRHQQAAGCVSSCGSTLTPSQSTKDFAMNFRCSLYISNSTNIVRGNMTMSTLICVCVLVSSWARFRKASGLQVCSSWSAARKSSARLCSLSRTIGFALENAAVPLRLEAQLRFGKVVTREVSSDLQRRRVDRSLRCAKMQICAKGTRTALTSCTQAAAGLPTFTGRLYAEINIPKHEARSS